MISVTEKTLQDLQFPTVLETISNICNTYIGKQKALEIKPFQDKETLMNALMHTWSMFRLSKITMPFPITILMPSPMKSSFWQ